MWKHRLQLYCRCVIVKDGKVVARGSNRTNESRNVSISSKLRVLSSGHQGPLDFQEHELQSLKSRSRPINIVNIQICVVSAALLLRRSISCCFVLHNDDITKKNLQMQILSNSADVVDDLPQVKQVFRPQNWCNKFSYTWRYLLFRFAGHKTRWDDCYWQPSVEPYFKSRFTFSPGQALLSISSNLNSILAPSIYDTLSRACKTAVALSLKLILLPWAFFTRIALVVIHAAIRGKGLANATWGVPEHIVHSFRSCCEGAHCLWQ